MRRADLHRWESARTLADLGELVARWLEGDLKQTPSHGAPPDPETASYADLLARVNRAGMITENMEAAGTKDGESWPASLHAWVPGPLIPAVLAATAGTGLIISTAEAARKDALRWWRYCLAGRLADQLAGCEYVRIADPVPGRPGVLWEAMDRFAVCAPITLEGT